MRFANVSDHILTYMVGGGGGGGIKCLVCMEFAAVGASFFAQNDLCKSLCSCPVALSLICFHMIG